MSRLIVKNLPKSVTEPKLKELFSEKGIVTDVQLKYTKDGKFRHFGFIGFKTEEEALKAKEYFDKTCIDTFRISVDVCADLGDPSKPKSWSKYAPDSSSYKQLHDKTKNDKDGKAENNNENETPKEAKKKKKKNKEEQSAEVKEAIAKHKDDPLFMEFLESHAVADSKKNWINDAVIETIANQGDQENDEKNDSAHKNDEGDKEEDKEMKEEKDEKEKIANKVISDLEYMEALKKKTQTIEKKEVSASKHGPVKFFTVKLRGLGYNHKKKHIKQFFHPLKPKSIRVPPKIKGIAYVGFKSEQQMRKALLKNKSFFEGKQIFLTKYEEHLEIKEDNNTETNNSNVKWKKQEESLKNEESIAESGRMFIRNLTYTTTEDDIRQLFEKYGPLTEVNLPVDRTTRKPKGFGTITFLMPEHAIKAYTELDGSILNGRMLHLLPGKAKSSILDHVDLENLPYKQKKEIQNKMTANSSHNWNTLFLGQNAIAEAIAATYNTTKEHVLEDDSKGMSTAVKLALGETQLVQETKKFLEENEVSLDAFNQPSETRSKNVILVKNLPAGTESKEIYNMFSKHGELGRVVMPPSGITALVEFLEPSEARKAFTKLAYTKFKHLPLYLEWAPDNSFTKKLSESNKNKNKHNVQNKLPDTVASVEMNNVDKDKSNEKHSNEENKEMEEDDEEPEPETTIFVKNINFSTTESALKEYFAKCGPIHYAMIATKKDLSNPGGKLSMGYGFVRYKYQHDANRALKTLQMTVLDGKTLELKRSERTLASDVKTAKKSSKVTPQTGTKILVRNVPFQATVQEIAELFKAFGELKAVRLPKKLIGAEKHRGFGFVEYYTRSEAKRAFQALCQSTHLYGRRLVLEWAQKEEGIEEIRKRTAKHFHEESVIKKSKKSVLNPETVGLEEEEVE
ncbi:PREDICTED: probable RNA-binding protein 19 [Polistes dominula]|uniref:Probable RNA-binding protein 19 n=1 Tax=Polistes dominula TaxID=743375 RepID=A0ABM1JGF3_POLDO|nr:PREDICTED: probable RNA-binding protein 19 [Polistes dominula]